MQRILAEAAAVGNATARAFVFSTRDQDAYFYPNSAWKMYYIDNDYAFSPGGVLNLDARTLLYYIAAGTSPAAMVKMVGLGSQYAYAERDAAGQYLDGGKTYRLHLPAHIPAKDFWSVLIYDPQTRSMLQTDQRFPSTGRPPVARHRRRYTLGPASRPTQGTDDIRLWQGVVWIRQVGRQLSKRRRHQPKSSSGSDGAAGYKSTSTGSASRNDWAIATRIGFNRPERNSP
jgi:hypothetical protein